MLFVYVTCKNSGEAGKIGKALVKKRLAACAVIVPAAASFFWWDKKLVKTKEALLLLKAGEKHKSQLEREIKKMHSYEIPCILFFFPKTTEDYSEWVEIASRSASR